MIRRSAAAFLSVLLLLLLPSAAFAGWALDPDHTSIRFRVKSITTVEGEFHKFSGTVNYDEGDVSRSSVDVSIDAASIDTGIGLRDKDLRSARFLDVAAHPSITFRSRKVEPAGAGKLRVTGDLSIKGVTKEAVLAVEGPSAAVTEGGKTRVSGTATTVIRRSDFGVSAHSWMIGEDVEVTIALGLVK
jgi:polyisoprenoid-binding protein YceI